MPDTRVWQQLTNHLARNPHLTKQLNQKATSAVLSVVITNKSMNANKRNDLKWRLSDQLIMTRMHDQDWSHITLEEVQRLDDDIRNYARACVSRFTPEESKEDPGLNAILDERWIKRYPHSRPFDIDYMRKTRSEIPASTPLNRIYYRMFPDDLGFTEAWNDISHLRTVMYSRAHGGRRLPDSEKAILDSQRSSKAKKLGLAAATAGVAALGLGGLYAYTHKATAKKQKVNGKLLLVSAKPKSRTKIATNRRKP